jgi:muramidase (phage lysozyme)
MTNKPVALLSFIRGAETSRGYEDFYRGSVLNPPKPVTQMTVREVQEWQKASVRAGSKSSAVGGYQIISKTFKTLVNKMGLTGDEVFDQDLQDRMGISLLEGRGYNKWASGQMDDHSFAANLSKEWASLPTSSGKSAYHGDGLNAATRSTSDLFGALNAARNGEQVDLSGLTDGGGGSPAGGGAPAQDPAQAARMSLITDTKQVGGMGIAEVGTTPSASFVSDWERQDAEKAMEAAPQYNAGQMIAAAFDEQQITTNLLRQLGKETFAPDPAFQSKGFDEVLWKEVTEGLPSEYQGVFDEAVSADHARALAASTRESYKRDAGLAQWGWTGVGAQMAASILDPVAIAASAVTEGAAAPLIYGSKLTKLGRAFRAGVAGMAVNTAIDGYLISQDPAGDWKDLSYSAAAGFLLGGAQGAFRSSPVDAEFADHMRKVERQGGTITDPIVVPNDSLSAARNPDAPLTSDVGKALEIVGDAPTAVFGKARIDVVGRLKTSENPIMRWVAERFDEDAVGNKSGTVTVVSAMEIKTRLKRVTSARFYKEHAPAFKAWSKEQGHGIRRVYDPAIRAEFNTLVGKAVRRPLDADGNVHVNKAASRAKQEYAEMVKLGKEMGIKGFDELDANDLYLNRQWNVQAIDDWLDTYNQGKVGADRGVPLYRMLADSMVEGTRRFKMKNPGRTSALADLDNADAFDLSKAFVNSIRSRKYQSFDMERGLAGHDLDTLKDMLIDAEVSLERATDIINKLTPEKDPKTGKIGNAKHRVRLDETWVDSKTGMSIEDFLENDIEALFGNYTDSVLGEAAYQRVFRDLRLPDDAYDGVVDETLHAPSYQKVKSLIAQADKRPSKVVNEEMQNLDILYRALKGIPQENDTAWTNSMRRLRSWNFVRVMGQLGVAQLSELGMIVGNGGMRGMIYHMPSFSDFILKAKRGKLDLGLMDELEAMMSPGMDVLAHSPHIRLDDGSEVSSMIRGGKATRMQKVDYALNNAKGAVATLSGMTHINRMLQRFNSRVIVQRFVDAAHNQKGVLSRKGITAKRYEALGIDKDMAARISKQITKFSKVRDGMIGKRVQQLDINAWTDIDAKNAFINGVNRWSRRSLQENSAGTMPAFMSKEMGKTIGQFRSFMLGAYTKQLLAGFRQSDWETYSSFMASMFFGGMFYVGQTQMNSVGRPDRDEWLEKRLSAEAIAKASFQRAGFSTFLPMLVDTAAKPFADGPIFEYRTTDLASGVWGNPTMDLIQSAEKAASGAIKALVNSDYDYSQQDARNATSLVPIQNGFIIRNMLALTIGQLPQFSQ